MVALAPILAGCGGRRDSGAAAGSSSIRSRLTSDVARRLQAQLAPGIVKQALAAGTTCTLTAAGPPGALAPVEPSIAFPVVIIDP